jgi:hypothetical protein
MSAWLLRTLDTVVMDTPRSAAIRFMVVGVIVISGRAMPLLNA